MRTWEVKFASMTRTSDNGFSYFNLYASDSTPMQLILFYLIRKKTAFYKYTYTI